MQSTQRAAESSSHCCLPVRLQLYIFIYPYDVQIASFSFFLKEVELFLALECQFLLRDFISIGNHSQDQLLAWPALFLDVPFCAL